MALSPRFQVASQPTSDGRNAILITYASTVSKGEIDAALFALIREEVQKAILNDTALRESVREAIKAATVALPVEVLTATIRATINGILAPAPVDPGVDPNAVPKA